MLGHSCVRTRSLNRLSVCCFLLLGVLCAASSSETQKLFEFGRPLYRFFSTREYRADNQNWAAIQDWQGLLLFGNDNLVLQYDGQRWEHISVPGGSAIQGLAVDESGEMRARLLLQHRLDLTRFDQRFFPLANEDQQILGCTLPAAAPGARGAEVYAESETARLSDSLNRLYYSLAEKRISVLPLLPSDGPLLSGCATASRAC